ncbi:hypothetical protein [Syntrophomonas wolfei]|uniref:Uncharacterized protein n=1 Tax=Syntrophomonas wolfei subsp. wolfei (strain DSM 2245B / Goettingen) TaxID=335541 RepID=Q0AUD5_SYNWW|nr:hypothetical protein [Syntrophomonas wolfei]ABI69669.1 hypothetical protein Swol_2380 [Syntrophomonas wolfei subsp. wolfei str. Goettingen G311]
MEKIIASSFLPVTSFAFNYEFNMNSMVRYLIIITLCYYFLKGLIYLLLWQTTHKIEERAREQKRKEKEKRESMRRIWEDEEIERDDDSNWW